MKKRIALMLAASLAVSVLGGCGSTSTETAEKTTETAEATET